MESKIIRAAQNEESLRNGGADRIGGRQRKVSATARRIGGNGRPVHPRCGDVGAGQHVIGSRTCVRAAKQEIRAGQADAGDRQLSDLGKSHRQRSVR